MGEFSGMLNSRNGWKGYIAHCKYTRVYGMQKFQKSIRIYRNKYDRYSRTQPDLYHEKGKAYTGPRSWNVGKPDRPGRKLFSLMRWRKK